MGDFEWRGKTALVRADLNVPLRSDGAAVVVADEARVAAVVPTIQKIVGQGGRVLLLSHLGRPTEGERDESLSLAPVAACLQSHLNMAVQFLPSLDEAQKVRDDSASVMLLENTRFNVGEKKNDVELARRYAQLGSVFVMDAFATAHRAEASITGIMQAGLPACAGLLVEAELAALARVVGQLQRPLVGIFGGAKISTKIKVVRRMIELCDVLIIGGGMANTLMKARGAQVGASMAQDDMLDVARELLAAAGSKLRLPSDVVVARGDVNSLSDDAVREAAADDVRAGEKILDIGAQTQTVYESEIAAAKTIIWNGPVGLFEVLRFAAGTAAVARAVAKSSAYSLIGGGDTIAAVRASGVLDSMSYVSTAGGALLEYLASEPMPALRALELSAQQAEARA